MTETTPQKARPDFIAGYDAGMADGHRIHEMKERDGLRQHPNQSRFQGNKLKFNIEFAKRQPLIAVGFVTPLEFVFVIWPVSIRLAWGY